MLMGRKARSALLAFLAIVLFLVGAWTLGWIPSQAKYCEYNLYTEHEKCTVDQIAMVGIRYVGWFLNFISPAATWIATAVIGAYTIVLSRVTGRQAALTRESIDLARQEFIATHRPKIIVYGVDVKLPGDTGNDRQVHFRYVNVGDSEAVVTSISSCIHVARKDRPPAGLELHRHTVIRHPILCKSGEHGFAITPDSVSFINLVRSGKPPNEAVFCVGVIAYRDKNDIERLTGFCRRYDGNSERWLQLADHDYEYAY
jgi:hypothetical protein